MKYASPKMKYVSHQAKLKRFVIPSEANAVSVIALALALTFLIPMNALAWGAKGHTLINQLAAEDLPSDMPAFLHTQHAIDAIAMLGPEEDRLKGAGESWDDDNDPGHYVDIGDDGTIDGVRLTALPESLNAYAIALESAGSTPWRVGYLPYSIIDGFELVREDFAYWRVDDYAAAHVSDPTLRARFAADRDLREVLIVRDIGVWGHFVGDACQPLHVTIHYNGWGKYPNPQNYTQAHIHSLFESEFVNRYVTEDAVRAAVSPISVQPPAALLSQNDVASIVATYLQGSAAAVVPLYQIEASSGFDNGSLAAVTFTVHQLARGVVELRDLSDLAWSDSIYASVGYPAVAVNDILSGRVAPTAALLGTV